MSADTDIRQILDQAVRYVIHKSTQGITVGLQLDEGRYGEAHSSQGRLEDAVREAYQRALAARRTDGGGGGGGGKSPGRRGTK